MLLVYIVYSSHKMEGKQLNVHCAQQNRPNEVVLGADIKFAQK